MANLVWRAALPALLLLDPALPVGGAMAAEPVSIVLVARAGLSDANFVRSVVLVTRSPQAETIGVILNRRIRNDSEPLQLPEEAKVRELYFGGPLAPRGLLGIGTFQAVPESAGASAALDVLPGLQLVVGAGRVRAMVQASAPGRVKVFAGYAGWAPGQLEREISRGGWNVLPASEEIVFDAAPETQWDRLAATLRAVQLVPQPATAMRVPGLRRSGQSACLVRTYSMRSIERTSMSRTSLPCSTLSGIESPALPPVQSF